MKIRYKYVLFAVLFFLAKPLFGQFYFSPIVFGTGLDISENNASMDIDLTLLHTEIQFFSGFGFAFDLLRYNYISNEHYLCVVNPQFFWNIFRLIPNKNTQGFDPVTREYNESLLSDSAFGPFIQVAPVFDFSQYILFTGLRFTYKQFPFILSNTFLLHFEAGYKYISGDYTDSFYISVKFDVLLGSLLLLFSIFRVTV
jgi:hypothetical protein